MIKWALGPLVLVIGLWGTAELMLFGIGVEIPLAPGDIKQWMVD